MIVLKRPMGYATPITLVNTDNHKSISLPAHSQYDIAQKLQDANIDASDRDFTKDWEIKLEDEELINDLKQFALQMRKPIRKKTENTQKKEDKAFDLKAEMEKLLGTDL